MTQRELRSIWTMKYHGEPHLILEEGVGNEEKRPVLLRSSLLQSYPGLHHAFSTRLGGVSSGVYDSMNLSFSRGDVTEHVHENFRRIARDFGQEETDFVLTYQTHTVNVREATGEDLGKGTTRERDYRDIDALMTDVPGIILGVFWADCVPILFYDPVHRAIAAAHSGWRGTVGRIGREVLLRMKERYGTDLRDAVAVIGPSICQDCYEVSEDVAEQFRQAFPGQEDRILWRGRTIYAPQETVRSGSKETALPQPKEPARFDSEELQAAGMEQLEIDPMYRSNALLRKTVSGTDSHISIGIQKNTETDRANLERRYQSEGSWPKWDARLASGAGENRSDVDQMNLGDRHCPDGQQEEVKRESDRILEQKYQLNLWEAVRITLLEAGMREEKIELGQVCTCCNPELLFSHRKQGEARGNNGAFLMLEKS